MKKSILFLLPFILLSLVSCTNDNNKLDIDNSAILSRSVSSVADDLFIRPIAISKDIYGPYDNIDNYRYATGQSYNLTTSDDFCLKCEIENKSAQEVKINLGSITFAYGYSTERYTPISVLYADFIERPSPASITGNSTITVIFYLGNQWSQYILPNNSILFNPYYPYSPISTTGYAYCLLQ